MVAHLRPVSSLTEEQMVLRRTGIGGSEIGAICGLGGFSSRIEIWRSKVDPTYEREGSRSMNRGVFLEPSILQWYCHDNGASLTEVKHPGTVRHAKRALCLASPDALLNDLLIEIKSPGRGTLHAWGEPGTDQIPDYYMPQVQWTMGACGVHKADVVALLGDELAVYRVAFNGAMFDTMYQIGEAFWRKYVTTKVAPPPDGSDAYNDFLAEKFPSSKRPMKVDNDPRVAELVRSYDEAKAATEVAEKREKELRQSLVELIGDADGLTGDWGTASYKSTKDREHLDTKALVGALHQHGVGELVQKFTDIRPGYRTMRIKLKGV